MKLSSARVVQTKAWTGGCKDFRSEYGKLIPVNTGFRRNFVTEVFKVINRIPVIK